jgi:hypothetical protein
MTSLKHTYNKKKLIRRLGTPKMVISICRFIWTNIYAELITAHTYSYPIYC